MLDNVKTTDLVEHALLSATQLSPEAFAALERFDGFLDALHELSCYLDTDPDSEERDDACREFCEDVISNLLHRG